MSIQLHHVHPEHGVHPKQRLAVSQSVQKRVEKKALSQIADAPKRRLLMLLQVGE
jgi:hypothetical protein